MGAITTCLGLTFPSLEQGHDQDRSSMGCGEVISAIGAVPVQFRDDCRALLFAPFVFGFGITTAMFSYFVNSEVISDSSDLGTVTLGFLEAWYITIIIMLLSAPFYYYHQIIITIIITISIMVIHYHQCIIITFIIIIIMISTLLLYHYGIIIVIINILII